MPERWNQRYALPCELPQVSYGLLKHSHLLPKDGIGLDLACGLGQNSIFLTKHGLTMHGWDYSEAGLAQMAEHCSAQKVEVNQQCLDLTNTPWPEQQFNLICVNAYLERALCPQIIEHLQPGGILVYQTFNQVTEIAGESLRKPNRPQLLLASNELLKLFSELEPLVYHDEQELAEITHPLAGKALLIARKTD
ncbi:MAG: class I SAM-dependent methyltransferase [Gammaproteobacteria bacterium]|nr:class I SAM-dependent methyltransferase [Gammaproteobacteria bacterium]